MFRQPYDTAGLSDNQIRQRFMVHSEVSPSSENSPTTNAFIYASVSVVTVIKWKKKILIYISIIASSADCDVSVKVIIMANRSFTSHPMRNSTIHELRKLIKVGVFQNYIQIKVENQTFLGMKNKLCQAATTWPIKLGSIRRKPLALL